MEKGVAVILTLLSTWNRDFVWMDLGNVCSPPIRAASVALKHVVNVIQAAVISIII